MWGSPCGPKSSGNNTLSNASPELSSTSISICIFTSHRDSHYTRDHPEAAPHPQGFSHHQGQKPGVSWNSRPLLFQGPILPWGLRHQQNTADAWSRKSAGHFSCRWHGPGTPGPGPPKAPSLKRNNTRLSSVTCVSILAIPGILAAMRSRVVLNLALCSRSMNWTTLPILSQMALRTCARQTARRIRIKIRQVPAFQKIPKAFDARMFLKCPKGGDTQLPGIGQLHRHAGTILLTFGFYRFLSCPDRLCRDADEGMEKVGHISDLYDAV